MHREHWKCFFFFLSSSHSRPNGINEWCAASCHSYILALIIRPSRMRQQTIRTAQTRSTNKKKCASKLFEHYECNGNEWQWHILYIYNAQLMHIAINPNTACASVRQRETENSNCVRKKIDTARDNARFRFMSMCCMLMQQQQQQREMCWRGCDVHQTKHKSIAVSECCCAHNFLITFRSFCVQHYYYYFIHFSGHDIDFWRRLRHRKHTQNIENIVVYLSGKASI